MSDDELYNGMMKECACPTCTGVKEKIADRSGQKLDHKP
jgi:hypothetical protein